MCEPVTWPYAALVLRVTLGLLFIAHLYWKFRIHDGGFAKWWSNFATNGYPWFVPYYVVSAEVLGALLLIPGIQTRLVSLYAVPMMLGAAHFWWVRKGFFFTAGGCELPLVWAVMLLVQALLGDGAFALRPWLCPTNSRRILAYWHAARSPEFLRSMLAIGTIRRVGYLRNLGALAYAGSEMTSSR